MAELIPKERLQPSLLDRLVDEQPEEKSEPLERRVLSMAALRQSVLRDIGWLLNARSIEPGTDLETFPFAASSTLNFGIRDLSGSLASSLSAPELEQIIVSAIRKFEPRIIPDTLRVRVETEEVLNPEASVAFVIEGTLWSQPLPISLYIRSQLNLESGDVLVETDHASPAT